MLWETKVIPQQSFSYKTAAETPFLQKTFPKIIQADIYEWQTFAERAELARHYGIFDDFIIDTLPNYATTILNGFLAISGGFLNTEVGTATEVGYSRVSHRWGRVIDRPFTVKSLIRINAWHSQFSDLATGFSTEAIVGNTAYRGDLSVWVNGTTIRLFFRQTRASPINTIVIASVSPRAGDWIYTELEHFNSQTRYLIRVNNTVVASGTATTFTYTVPMHAVIGARHGLGTPVTSISVDQLSLLSDVVSSSVVTAAAHTYTSVVDTTYLHKEMGFKPINHQLWGYKVVPEQLWSIKNAS